MDVEDWFPGDKTEESARRSEGLAGTGLAGSVVGKGYREMAVVAEPVVPRYRTGLVGIRGSG